jgi:hypothetical protein
MGLICCIAVASEGYFARVWLIPNKIIHYSDKLPEFNIIDTFQNIKGTCNWTHIKSFSFIFSKTVDKINLI